MRLVAKIKLTATPEEKISLYATLWSCGQLREFIEYKAKPHGVTVEMVDPKNISRRCPCCGYTHKKNRKSQREFCCCECNIWRMLMLSER